MERHPAFPCLENIDRMIEVMLWVVEQNTTQPAANHHADNGPEAEIVDLRRAKLEFGEFSRDAPCKPQPNYYAENIGQSVPSDWKRSEMKSYRIDIWKIHEIY